MQRFYTSSYGRLDTDLAFIHDILGLGSREASKTRDSEHFQAAAGTLPSTLGGGVLPLDPRFVVDFPLATVIVSVVSTCVVTAVA